MRRVYILKDSQTVTELDLWPGDEVWHPDMTKAGHVNADGTFVPYVSLS